METFMPHEMKCGCFQILFVFLTQLTRFSALWGVFIMMFGNYEPPWKCVMQESDDQNISTTLYRLLSSTDAPVPFYALGTHNNVSDFITGGESNASTNATVYESSCKTYSSCPRIDFDPGSSTIVSEFELICDRTWIASLIISVQMFAVIPGSFIGGQVGEVFGRKASVYGFTALLSASLALAIFSVSWEMYAVFYFFNGLACGGILATCNVFSMEFLNPWWRATLSSMPVSNGSLIIFTLIIVWLRDWRMIHIAAAIMSAVTLLGVIWVPESLRWLQVQGKRKEADKVWRKICKTNRMEYSPASLMNDLSNEPITSELSSQKRVNHMTYLDLFRDPYIRSITLKSSVAWLCGLMVYVSLSYGIKSLDGDFYVNIIISSVSETPTILLMGPLANKLGRRWAVMIILTLGIAACGASVLVHFTVEGDSKGLSIRILAIVTKACASAAWCGMSTMSVELFPTVVRSLGYGFLHIVSGAGGIIAPYLIPQQPSWFGVCYAIMTFLLIISTISTMSLPETRNKPLTDVMPELERLDDSVPREQKT